MSPTSLSPSLDLSYFFSNQEGSVLPVDSKNFCKSFVEATYHGPDPGESPTGILTRAVQSSFRRFSSSSWSSRIFGNPGRGKVRGEGTSEVKNDEDVDVRFKRCSLLVAFPG